MKTLILMRHAKSDWSTGEESDHARPLNRRGRASALALGNWLRGKGWLPDQVLCSTARRTRETLAGLGLEVEADYRDALYHAEVEALLEAVRGATGGTVLIIGHNPGIGELAERLVAGEVVVLFAEGTTSDGNRVLPFKSSLFGAASAALPAPAPPARGR